MSSSMHRPQHLIMLAFLLQPLALGNWLPRIPEIQERLGLGPAELALALLGMPIGLLATMPFVGPLVARFGARATVLSMFPAFLAVMALPAFATHIAILFAALVLCGIVVSMLELGLNVVADEIEKSDRVAIMSRCHGFWSLGMMMGSLIGAALAGARLSPQWSAVAVSLIVLPLGLLVTRALPQSGAHVLPTHQGKSTGLFIPGWLLLGICVVALGSNLLEGASADWSAVYLTQVFGASAVSAGLGYSAYALMMAAGRFAGDWMRSKWGPVIVVRVCYLLATIGVVFIVFSSHYPLALVGYALAGFGGSVGVPLAISAAASAGRRPPATNVAMVTLVSLIGFLCGPPIIGLVAQHFGLRAGIGLLLLPVLIASIAVAGTLRKARSGS
jgi:MFS family permease